MSVKKYIILSKDGLHEYDLTVEDTKKGEKFSLFTSNGEQWNEPHKGKLLLSMTNDGDGIKFDRKLKVLDYAQLLYIRILVNFEHQNDRNPKNREKYRVIENKTVIKM